MVEIENINDTSGNLVFITHLKSYQIIDGRTSAGSAVTRAGVGALLLGPIGLAAGLSAKKKYTVLLFFDDNEQYYKEKQKVVELNSFNFKCLLEYAAKKNIMPM